MILFPYANDVEYKDGHLSFTIQFFAENKETQVEVKMEASDELRDIMEKLMVS